MEISNVALQPMPTGSPSKAKDLAPEIQKLEQLKRDIKQQIKQLEQSKQGGDTVKSAKDKLKKKLEEVEQQISVLKQQDADKMQPTEDSPKVRPPRFDKYEKDNPEASGVGLYSMENDENGSPTIVFDSPEKPQPKAPNSARTPREYEKPNGKKTILD